MAYTWVVNPLMTIELEDEQGKGRGVFVDKPKIATLIDPSTGKTYQHTSAIGVGTWVLSLVNGGDFSPIDQDPACEIIFIIPLNTHPEVFLNMTLIDLQLTQGEVNTLRSKMDNAGIQNSDLSSSDSTETWLNRVSTSQGGGQVRGMYV